jgi:uncharacterized membrane protein
MNTLYLPASPWFVHVAWAAIVVLHVSAGILGLASGAVALIAPKGQRLHRLAGTVFFVSMLIMAALGAAISPFMPQPQWGNVTMGVFVIYLVATSWVTISRAENSAGVFELGAGLFAVGAAAAGAIVTLWGAKGPLGSGSFVFVGIALLAAGGDLRVFWRGGISGAARIARHLWRMCLVLLIAAISLFLGQQQLFPALLRKTGALLVPEALVLGLLIFWLVRVRFTAFKAVVRVP